MTDKALRPLSGLLAAAGGSWPVAVLGALLGLLLSMQVASAHVGVTPGRVPPDSNQTFTVRVPNERDEPTVKVRVELPAGLMVSRFQPKPGWTRQVDRDAQQIITAVTWSGGQIGAGEYEDFPLTARVPREAGTLTFKSYQTYQSGDTVEWIAAEGGDRPAAFVTVAMGMAAEPGMSMEGAAVQPAAAASPVATAPTGSQPAAAPTGVGREASGSSDLPLFAALGALVLALLALVVSGIALSRRSQAA